MNSTFPYTLWIIQQTQSGRKCFLRAVKSWKGTDFIGNVMHISFVTKIHQTTQNIDGVEFIAGIMRIAYYESFDARLFGCGIIGFDETAHGRYNLLRGSCGRRERELKGWRQRGGVHYREQTRLDYMETVITFSWTSRALEKKLGNVTNSRTILVSTRYHLHHK